MVSDGGVAKPCLHGKTDGAIPLTNLVFCGDETRDGGRHDKSEIHALSLIFLTPIRVSG